MNIRVLFPVLLLSAWIGFCAFMSNRYCCGTTVATEQDALSLVPLKSVEEESSKMAAEGKGFGFFATASTLDTALSADLKSLLAYTTGYLQNHPERCLVLTGLYTTNEKSVNTDIGLARATAVEQLFLNEGIANTQIKIKQDMVAATGERLENAVHFDFEPMLDQTILLADIQAKNTHPKLILHFDLDQKELSLTPAQEQFFQNLLIYTQQNDQQKILVIGFTDNQGETRQNFGLGRERSAFVKDHLVEMGFDKQSIMTDSQGENNPICSNETKEGRAKNRRVEVEIKRRE